MVEQKTLEQILENITGKGQYLARLSIPLSLAINVSNKINKLFKIIDKKSNSINFNTQGLLQHQGGEDSKPSEKEVESVNTLNKIKQYISNHVSFDGGGIKNGTLGNKSANALSSAINKVDPNNLETTKLTPEQIKSFNEAIGQALKREDVKNFASFNFGGFQVDSKSVENAIQFISNINEYKGVVSKIAKTLIGTGVKTPDGSEGPSPEGPAKGQLSPIRQSFEDYFLFVQKIEPYITKNSEFSNAKKTALEAIKELKDFKPSEAEDKEIEDIIIESLKKIGKLFTSDEAIEALEKALPDTVKSISSIASALVDILKSESTKKAEEVLKNSYDIYKQLKKYLNDGTAPAFPEPENKLQESDESINELVKNLEDIYQSLRTDLTKETAENYINKYKKLVELTGSNILLVEPLEAIKKAENIKDFLENYFLLLELPQFEKHDKDKFDEIAKEGFPNIKEETIRKTVLFSHIRLTRNRDIELPTPSGLEDEKEIPKQWELAGLEQDETEALKFFLSQLSPDLIQEALDPISFFNDLVDKGYKNAQETFNNLTTKTQDLIYKAISKFKNAESIYKKQDEKAKIIASYGVTDVEFGRWNAIIIDKEWNVKGIIALNKTEEPCLPNTYEVSYVAVAAELSGKGFGSYMYDLAAANAQQLGGKNSGITSDRRGSSTKMAGGIWNRISKKYNAKETKMGNKKFDYDDNTKDQQDDCNRPPGGNPATDYSWIVPDNLKSRALKIFNLQKRNVSEKDRPKDFDQRVMKFWEKEYGRGKKSGIVERLETKLSQIILNVLREENG